MTIRFFDNASDTPDYIASLDINRLRRTSDRLKLEEVHSLRDADLAIGHFTFAQIGSLAGFREFEPVDIIDWHAILGDIRTWSGILAPDAAQKLAYAERTGADGETMKKKVVDVLNDCIKLPRLTTVSRFENLTGEDALFLRKLGPETLNPNELYRLNRYAIEGALNNMLRPAVFDSGWEEFPESQSVIVVTTQAGFPDRFPFQHTVLRLPGRTRRLLFAKDMTGLTESEEELDQILSLTAEQLDRIISGNVTGVPRAASRLFLAEQPDLLQALQVLTIGYLSASSIDTAPDVRDQIGLTRALSRLGPSSEDLRRTLSRQKSTVTQPEWWLRGFGVLDAVGNIREHRWKRFLEDVNQQWTARGDKKNPDSALDRLLAELHGAKEIGSADLVLKAHDELAERLRV